MISASFIVLVNGALIHVVFIKQLPDACFEDIRFALYQNGVVLRTLFEPPMYDQANGHRALQVRTCTTISRRGLRLRETASRMSHDSKTDLPHPNLLANMLAPSSG
jgi:hypothetical protein